MTGPVRIALIGDHDAAVTAHRAIPLALARSAESLHARLSAEWLATETLAEGPTPALRAAAGVWCVPASPYRSESGALHAIRYARRAGVPFLGTCGGFQHALLDYARDVWGLADAAHAETGAGAADPVIAPLACDLVERQGEVTLAAGSRLARWYGAGTARETYHCRYGLASRHAARLAEGPLQVAARDGAGEVRAVELEGHPFFVATLYQPERAGLEGRAHPLVTAFVDAAVRYGAGTRRAAAGDRRA